MEGPPKREGACAGSWVKSTTGSRDKGLVIENAGSPEAVLYQHNQLPKKQRVKKKVTADDGQPKTCNKRVIQTHRVIGLKKSTK